MLIACLCAVNLAVVLSAVWDGLAGPLVAIEVEEQNCTGKWFGENCSYICYCNANPEVCENNGACPGVGVCENAHFGPGCQYVDLLYAFGTHTNPAYLTDANDSTCSRDTTSTSVSVSLHHAMTFLWFRITVKDTSSQLNLTLKQASNVNVTSPASLLDFTVKLNGVETCHNERRYKLSDTEMDIACDTAILLHTLELRGPVAHTLCSLRISGGRNVAIRQRASQSSTRNVQTDISGPELAVDGNTNQDYNSGSCSHTSLETEGPSWRLSFNRPQMLIRAMIYNRLVANEINFVGNTMATFDNSNNMTSFFKIFSSAAGAVYEIMMFSRDPVAAVVIQRPPNIDFYYRLLNLCEVELYGETLCPEGTYGLFCNKMCNCGVQDICNIVTGLCAPGCDDGKYGYNCSMTCSETCFQRKCRNRHGECLQCVPGYTGEYCNKECLPGTYGTQCNRTCSDHCDGVCNFRTGACICRANFSAPLCIECVHGFHGEDCSRGCPKQCLYHICDRTTGLCEHCHGLRQGPLCESCPENYYGYLCYTKCSAYCGNGTCDKDNGSCAECTDGYRGPLCSIAPIQSYPWEYYFIPLPMCAVLVCICAMFMLRRKVPRHTSESRDMSFAENSSSSVMEPSHSF